MPAADLLAHTEALTPAELEKARWAAALSCQRIAVLRARRWTSDPELIKEAVHEALIAVYVSTEDYDRTRGLSFESWARWRIAQSLREFFGYNRRKRTTREPPLSLDAPGEQGETLLDLLPAQTGPADAGDLLDEVDQLSPGDRELLYLRFGLADGEIRSLAEIGAAYGVSAPAICQRLSHVLGRLRVQLGLPREIESKGKMVVAPRRARKAAP